MAFKKLKDILKGTKSAAGENPKRKRKTRKPNGLNTLKLLLQSMPWIGKTLLAGGKQAAAERRRLKFTGVRRKHFRLLAWEQSTRRANQIHAIRQASSKKRKPSYWQAGKLAAATPA